MAKAGTVKTAVSEKVMLKMRKFLALNHLTIRAKLNLLVVFALLGMALVGVAGWVSTWTVGGALRDLGDQNLPAITALGDLRLARLRAAEVMQGAANWRAEAFDGQAGKEDFLREAKGIFEDVVERQKALRIMGESAFQKYDALTKSTEEEQFWKEFRTLWDDFQRLDAYQDRLASDVIGASDWTELKQRLNQFVVATGRWSNSLYKVDAPLDRLVELNQAAAESSKSSGDRVVNEAAIGMAGIFGVALVVVWSLVWLIASSVVGPLTNMRESILHVADAKDFTGRLEVEGKDELAETARAFNLLLESMQVSLLEVMTGAGGIAEASEQICSVGSEVTNAANSQCDASASMARAIEQMIKNIGHLAESARDVLAQANEASLAANSGAASIEHTALAMEKIGTQVSRARQTINGLVAESGRIASVVSVIREVADQTNLLALNAAIEAARAGEQGRGFAVVADEVRKLADRTTCSAHEIGMMISAMQLAVTNTMSDMEGVAGNADQSIAAAEEAALRMNEISASANKVSEAIKEVSGALASQEHSAQEIAQRVGLVATLSRQNSMTATRVASLSQALDGASDTLHRVVHRFKL